MFLATLMLMGWGARAEPQRIVTIGGDVTEIVFALGAADRVVAVDTTSTWPPAVTKLPTVGYMRALAAEGVMALNPDLIVATDKAGPAGVVEQMRAVGIPFMLLTSQPGVEGYASRVTAIATALGRAHQGEALIRRMQDALSVIQRHTASLEQRPKVLFLLTTGSHGTPLASGAGTVADELIRLAGGRNAIQGYDQYKPLTAEAALAAAPDILLVASHSLAASGGRDAVLALPQIAATPAGRSGALVELQGSHLAGLGPRTPEAVVSLVRSFHPGMALPPDLLAMRGPTP